ncbi:MAG: hypothetical protein R6V35_03545 [Candidatus Nanohaloarchaea archaeon]
MTDLSLDRIKENERKIREELEKAEEIEESAFADARGTEELLEKLYNAGLSEEEVRRVIQNEEGRLIEEEQSEVSREVQGVEIEEDAILREKQNLGMLAERIQMVFDEEKGVEKEFQYLKDEIDGRQRPYDKEFKRDIVLNARRIADMLMTEAVQERAIVETENHVMQEIAFMVSETEFDEDLDGLQFKEERGTAGLGRKWKDESLVKVGNKLYQEVYRNLERSGKEAEQEANEAWKLENEVETAFEESRRTEEEAKGFINFLDFLVEEAGLRDFKEELSEVRAEAEKALKMAQGDEKLSGNLEEQADRLREEAKKAADI